MEPCELTLSTPQHGTTGALHKRAGTEPQCWSISWAAVAGHVADDCGSTGKEQARQEHVSNMRWFIQYVGAQPRVTRPVEPGKELVLGRSGKWTMENDERVSRTHASVALHAGGLLLRANSRVFRRASGSQQAVPVNAGASTQARPAGRSCPPGALPRPCACVCSARPRSFASPSRV